MRSVFAIFFACLFSAGALAQDAQPQPAPDAAPATVPVPPPASVPATPPGNPAPTGPKVLIETSMGDITIQLYSDRAPKGSANFLRYVKEKHFDRTIVYRVSPGYVVQMGSFLPNMTQRATHPPIPLEANNGLSNLRYTLAYARGDGPKEGARAEFFINLMDNTGLDQSKDDKDNKTGFAVFAQVVDGMDVVDKIAAVPVGGAYPMPGELPLTQILVKKVSLVPTPK